ncbi:hypothetical protein HT031_004719 [Scenedesmus sp. PABB004]|nr:hypothetical protein HT031_004719 [Scenedesmus sp. PABB004]
MLRTAGARARQLLLAQPGQQQAAFSRRWCSGAPPGAPKMKRPEQLTEEELQQSLPSMLFTTSNLIWSTALATGVAAGGLVAMFFVGSFITSAARSLRHIEEPPPPPPPRPLAELVAERKAELQAQLDELAALPRTPETRAALAGVKRELRQYGVGGSWWRWW